MSIRSTVGLADLADALRWLDPNKATMERVAATLGLKLGSDERTDENFIGELPPDSTANARDAAKKVEATTTQETEPNTKKLPDTTESTGLRTDEPPTGEIPVAVERLNIPRRTVPLPRIVKDATALPKWDIALPPVAKPDPLVPQHLARTFIWETLAQPLPGDEIDLEAVVDHLAKGSVPTLKRLRQKGLRNGVQVLIDNGPAMQPFHTDVQDLRERIRKVVGPSWFGELFFQSLHDQGRERGLRSHLENYQPPSPGTTILLVTDLGIGRPSGYWRASEREWSRFVRRLTLAGCRVIALVPYGSHRWPNIRHNAFKIMYWGTQEICDTQTEVRDFARLLAAAATLDRAIIRAARRKCFPHADAGLEADLLFSPLVGVSNARLISLRNEVLSELRDELASRPEEHVKAVRFLSDYRETSGTTERLRFEENLVAALLAGSAHEFNNFVASMIQAMIVREADHKLARSVVSLINELPRQVSEHPLCRQLQYAAALRLGTPPSDFEKSVTEHSWLLPDDTRIEVGWAGGNLIFRDPPTGTGNTIEVPSTVPRHILLKPAKGQSTRVQVWPGREDCIIRSDIPIELVALSGARFRVVQRRTVSEERQDERTRRDHSHNLGGHTAPVSSVAWSADQRYALSGSSDKTVRLWEVETGRCLRVLEGHSGTAMSVAWSADQRYALSGSSDKTVRLWEVETGRCLRVLEGHSGTAMSVAWSADQRYALSGSSDKTVRLWEVETGRCLRVLEGHSGTAMSVAWSADQRYALSGSSDKTVRLWEVETGRCLRVLEGHSGTAISVAWSADQRSLLSGDENGGIRVWDLSGLLVEARTLENAALSDVRYTNAKVLIVGDSGVGKTGLARRLADSNWSPSDSTVGAWATQWKLPVSSDDGVEREIWLWDFGGQADQRLIHQLYMDETALAVLVFDPQREDLFETLGQWDRDLTRASRKPFPKLLAAGRVDLGGLRVNRSQIEAFAKERGYTLFLETSAKSNIGCEELRHAILENIRWEDIPWRSSPLLFKRLNEEILRLKDEGRVLMRFNELRETLQLRLSGRVTHFTDEELRAVLDLLAGSGVVWELKFGSWVLLQPERINAYAQSVIQTMREDKYERGALPEERVLNGDLRYHHSIERLEAEEERIVLLTVHQTLVERGLCLREHTDRGAILIFPSYYRRERPELVGHPAVLVSYRFNGFLDDIYATLVVRLHYASPFEQDELWRYAADFKTLTGKRMGIKLTRKAEGAGELLVYFDTMITVEEKIIFSKYIHEHLLRNAGDVVRLRHYVCPYCQTHVLNREAAMERLAEKGKQANIICVKCEKRVPLWDDLEQRFASLEIQERVRQLQQESDLVLDSESKDRMLVGEVISAVSLAGQISRELTVSDHGIDMEIEFKSDDGKATGQRVYLQLRSGDSYLKKRKSDGAEIFKIEKPRHTDYWREQAFPVLLVIRTSDGKVRWMEIRDYLKRESDNGKKPVKQIVFTGERLDVMSVRRWRDNALNKNLP